MRSIIVSRVGGPEVLSVVTGVAVPKPKSGELLVKTLYSSVNYIDTYHRTGLYQRPLPFTPGREGAGVVEEIADGETQFKIGDRVAFIHPGSNSEYVTPSAGTYRRREKLPDTIQFDVGGSCLLVGLTGIMLTHETYRVQSGDTVLIHAIAGGVGQILCQLCKEAGATVIGTTSSEVKASIGKSLGADYIIDYTKADIVEEVKKITEGKGVNVVYDGVGKATFEASLASLKAHGWMMSFGNASGKPEPFDILRLSKGSLKLLRPTLFDFITSAEDFKRMATMLLNKIVGGKLKVQIFKTYPLDQIGQAHIDLESRKTTGKLVISNFE